MNVPIKLGLVLIIIFSTITALAQVAFVGKINRNTETPSKKFVPSKSVSFVNAKKSQAEITLKPNEKIASINPTQVQSEQSLKFIPVVALETNGLRSMLRTWGEKKRWTLVWSSKISDIPLPPGTRLDGDINSTVETITKLVPVDAKIQITMYEGNRVIYVHHR